jgi:hypothetical protein
MVPELVNDDDDDHEHALDNLESGHHHQEDKSDIHDHAKVHVDGKFKLLASHVLKTRLFATPMITEKLHVYCQG